ncbi:hypothetical protein DVH24_021266 [Malus domestica]|uniref:Uncharacterized protein n=1 Tax=Malus domestica TaxID=3750 RepID=A0A498HRK7_MALDO|nr:hypothetical protein DVH24_021266 [Malus domestica]
MCKMFSSTLERTTMRWLSLPARSINCFESLIDLLTNTYLVIMTPQSIDESIRTYLKRFHSKLAEVEMLNDRLNTMVFKQAL